MIIKNNEISRINAMCENTLMQTLRMECTDLGENWIKVRMPVNSNTHQSLGMLHGGASAALIESVGSMGSVMVLDIEKEVPLGIEVNANHLSAVASGYVVATGQLIHKGSKTHVWQVDIHHEETNKLVCTGRLTVMVVPRKK